MVENMPNVHSHSKSTYLLSVGDRLIDFVSLGLCLCINYEAHKYVEVRRDRSLSAKVRGSGIYLR